MYYILDEIFQQLGPVCIDFKNRDTQGLFTIVSVRDMALRFSVVFNVYAAYNNIPLKAATTTLEFDHQVLSYTIR
jgi:hypothetical protein